MPSVAIESRIDEAKAEKAVGFIENLTHTQGIWAGQPFILMPWQREIVREVFGTLNPDGTRQYRTVYIEIPRKNGKRLALDTPLPTPTGWIKMADIEIGTVLFDERGQPCRVIQVEAIVDDTDTHRLEFSDGTSIVADAEHLWWTRAKRIGRSRKHPQNMPIEHVKTTAEIGRTLWYDENGRERNHAVPVARPLDCPCAELLLPPYVLGAWLGDGNTANAGFTCAEEQIIAEIEAEGIPVRKTKEKLMWWLGNGDRRQVARNGSPQAILRSLGVLGNKHIPYSYLRASIGQRLALLQGLMDTDGHCSPRGQCEFTTTKPALRDGFIELTRSLGLKPTLKTKRAMLNGHDCGEKYRIQFRPNEQYLPFRLERKRCRLSKQPCGRSRWRQIVAVEPVASVPMRCIAVDSPSHLYLAGKGMVPTHNTELAAAMTLYLLFADHEVGAEIYGAAADRDQAGLVYARAQAMVEESEALSSRAKIIESTKRILFPKMGSFYRAIPADIRGSHGYNAHGIIFDELHVQPNRKLWDVLKKSRGARRQPLIIAITTAGFDRESICYELHEYARQILDGIIEDPTFFAYIQAAPEDADWTDEDVWYACNPALMRDGEEPVPGGAFRMIDEMREEARQAKHMPTAQNDFLRYYLDRWTQQSTRWIDMVLWDENAGVVDAEALKEQTCYGGLDLSSIKDMTAWLMAFPHDDDPDELDVVARFWCPEARLYADDNRYSAQYQVWAREGWLETTPGDAIDYNYVTAKVLEDAEAYGLVDMNIDRLFQGYQVGTELDAEGVTVVGFGMGFLSMAGPMREFERRLLVKKIHHGGNPVLRWMADQMIVKTDHAANLKPDKSNPQNKIDGIVALVMALDRAMRNQVIGEAGVSFV